MQIPPAENIFAKGAFCAFYKTSTYGDSFTVVKNKFIAVHIPDVFKIYYDSSVAHKDGPQMTTAEKVRIFLFGVFELLIWQKKFKVKK